MTHSQITIHATVCKTNDGYIPMLTLRGSKGRMLGSRTPQGDAREFRTFTTALAAEIEARIIALRCAQRYPLVLSVA